VKKGPSVDLNIRSWGFVMVNKKIPVTIIDEENETFITFETTSLGAGIFIKSIAFNLLQDRIQKMNMAYNWIKIEVTLFPKLSKRPEAVRLFVFLNQPLILRTLLIFKTWPSFFFIFYTTVHSPSTIFSLCSADLAQTTPKWVVFNPEPKSRADFFHTETHWPDFIFGVKWS